ncbi:ATP-binding protein [Streptomyces caelestis]
MGDTGLDGSSIRRVPADAGLREVSMTFGRDALRIADARDFAAGYLATSGKGRSHALSEDAVGAVLLVVSELMTNAVKYGSGPIELVLARTDGMVIVTVRDGGTSLPVPRPADPCRVGQHGLEIVAALSRDVDIRREPSGKRVTARIALG